MNYLPNNIVQLFWEYDECDLCLSTHKQFIVERVLEKGSSDCIKWLFEQFSSLEILNIVKSSINLSASTKIFWQYYFNLNV